MMKPSVLLSLVVLLALLLQGAAGTLDESGDGAAAAGGRFRVVHEGFEAFSGGEFEHAGQNIYVSRGGRIQLIHRWDLNNDGYYEFVFSNTHNVMLGGVDALGYLQTARGFRSAVSPVHRSIALYDLWLQEEKSRDRVVRFPVERPGAVQFHDLDRDGWTDILFASSGAGDTVSTDSLVYWGDATGYRTLRRVELPTVGARDLAVGDLNRDGYTDIVFANSGSRKPLSTGEGSYIYWGSSDRYGIHHRSVVPTRSAIGCALGDLNGDGHLDLIFATSEQGRGGLWFFPGSPEGPDLEAVVKVPVDDLQSVRVGSADGLGRVVLALSKKSLRLFAWDSGSLVEKKTVSLGGARAVMADLDQDRRADLVVASGDRSAVLWGKSGWSTDGALWLPTLEATDVTVADLNGDDRPDIAFANQLQGTHGDLDVASYVYWGESWGYGPESRTDLQTFGATAVAVGDIDRDGRPDLLFGNSGSGIQGGKGEEIYVYWGRPHRGYSPAAMTAYPCVMGMATLMADLDDDDHAELLVANSGRHYSGKPGASYIYRGGSSGPALEGRLDISAQEVGSWSVADLNRDGFLDALACDFDTLAIAWGSAAGFSTDPQRVEGVAKTTQNCRLVDFNRDGWLDVLVADVQGVRSRVLLGDGQGFSLDRSAWVEAAFVANSEFADLDGDGWLDMMLTRSYNSFDRNDSWIRIYPGGPEGFAQTHRFEFATAGAFDMAVADLDSDGDLDIAVSQYASRDRRNLPVYLFWNDGGGRFSSGRRTDLPAESSSGLLAADFDEDGHPDLLVFNHKTTYKEDNHSNESFVYWGSAQGYHTRNRSYLPAHGPHFMQNVDIGNLSSRRAEESYLSVPIEVPPRSARLVLSFQADTPLGSRVSVAVRTAGTSAELAKAAWRKPGPAGEFAVRKDDRWLQYRATLKAGRGHATPYLTRVAVEAVGE
ncbi:MAG: VCBS repeat-containing protein [Acidobacteriota bacterium]|nr:VCBS repeat-containing protein [Acidobacteriota bacterium]